MSLDYSSSSDKVNTGNNDPKDEWDSEPPTLVQCSGNRRPDQAANSETHGGDSELTPKALLGGGVTSTENGRPSVIRQDRCH